MTNPNLKITVRGNMHNPLHSGLDGVIVSVEQPMRSDTYMVSSSRNTKDDWWVYNLRPTGWIAVASLREGEHVPAGVTPTDIVAYVEDLLNRF